MPNIPADDFVSILDWFQIGNKAWLKQQFDKLHRDNMLLLAGQEDLKQQYFVLLNKLNDIEDKLNRAPWIAAATLGITVDQPVMK